MLPARVPILFFFFVHNIFNNWVHIYVTGNVHHGKPKKTFSVFYSTKIDVESFVFEKDQLKSYESFPKIINKICAFLRWRSRIQSAKQKAFHTGILSITSLSGLVSWVSETWAMWLMSCNVCFRNIPGNLSMTCDCSMDTTTALSLKNTKKSITVKYIYKAYQLIVVGILQC